MADPVDPDYRYSVNEYPTDGTQTTFEVSFAGGYISKTYVLARYTDAAGAVSYPAFTWTNDFTINISPALAAGGKVMVFRQTPADLPIVDFGDGAIINEEALDINSRQAVNLAAETRDIVGSIPALDVLQETQAALGYALNRANHTGTQAAATVTGLPAVVATVNNLATPGGASAIGKTGGGTIQDALNTIGSLTFSVAPPGSYNPLNISKTFNQADASGTSQVYSIVNRVYALGANKYNTIRGMYLGTHVNTTAGTTDLADGIHSYVWLGGAGSVASAQAVAGHIRVDGPGTISTEACVFRAVSTTLGSSALITTMKGLSLGALGDPTKVTNVYGIHIEDQSAASVVIGIRSDISAGTNKYFLFSGGSAASAHLGNLGVGISNTPLWKLAVSESASTYTADFLNTNASSPFGIRIRYSATVANGDNAFITCQSGSTIPFVVRSNGTVEVNGNRVLNSRGAAVAGPTGGATVDTQARTAINDLIARLQAHGLIA